MKKLDKNRDAIVNNDELSQYLSKKELRSILRFKEAMLNLYDFPKLQIFHNKDSENERKDLELHQSKLLHLLYSLYLEVISNKLSPEKTKESIYQLIKERKGCNCVKYNLLILSGLFFNPIFIKSLKKEEENKEFSKLIIQDDKCSLCYYGDCFLIQSIICGEINLASWNEKK